MLQPGVSGSARLPEAAEVPRGRATALEAGEAAECGSHSSELPPGDSSPSPKRRLFSLSSFLSSPFSPAQTVGVAGAARGGFEWLAGFHGFAKPVSPSPT